jgi:hypothetical protein
MPKMMALNLHIAVNTINTHHFVVGSNLNFALCCDT